MKPSFYTHCLECDDYESLSDEPTDPMELPSHCEACFAPAVQAVQVTACKLGDSCESDIHHFGLHVHVDELDL
jgi:hypothetical protein